jgi:diaminohydroxyphosphoribosylaminopyrimidine deaminase / 5-amino-6-(5-phosphoribosylamino)uracil reductase
LLDHLGERGVASLLVEGGATLSAALLQRRLVDKLVLFIAPKIIGADGLSFVGPCGVTSMDQVIAWHGLTSRQVGEDILLEAYLSDTPTPA